MPLGWALPVISQRLRRDFYLGNTGSRVLGSFPRLPARHLSRISRGDRNSPLRSTMRQRRRGGSGQQDAVGHSARRRQGRYATKPGGCTGGVEQELTAVLPEPPDSISNEQPFVRHQNDVVAHGPGGQQTVERVLVRAGECPACLPMGEADRQVENPLSNERSFAAIGRSAGNHRRQNGEFRTVGKPEQTFTMPLWRRRTAFRQP